MISKLRQSDFIRSVATLLTGTILAQLITYALSPIIMRLYDDPAQWSYFTLFAKVVAFFSVVATARYEVAFTLPKRDEHALSLYRLSMRITMIISAASMVLAIAIYFSPITDEKLRSILFYIPFGILFVAIYSQGSNWAIRFKQFRAISTSRILLSGLNSGMGIVLSPLGYSGLLYAYLASYFGSSIVFGRMFRKTTRNMKGFRLRGRKWAIARYYADFPRINMPHALIELSKELFIAFYLLTSFEKEALGLYDFSFRMLKAPLGMMGSAVGQVFFKKAADAMNDGQSLYKLASKTAFTLFLLSIVPFGILMLFGAPLFAFAFGEAWREAGYYAQIMSPWLMSNFVISPISQIPMILNRQRGFFILSLIGSAIMVSTLTIGDVFPSWNLAFVDILKIVSFGQTVFLIFVIFWTLKLAKSKS
jgi:teichuronic acid exporter